MKDRSMICIQCGNQFFLSSNEQEKLIARGFGLPKRCTECRKHKIKTNQNISEERDYKRKRKQSRRERNPFEDSD